MSCHSQKTCMVFERSIVILGRPNVWKRDKSLYKLASMWGRKTILALCLLQFMQVFLNYISSSCFISCMVLWAGGTKQRSAQLMLQLFTQILASNQLPHKQWLPREMHPQQELLEIPKIATSFACIQCWASSMNHQDTVNFLSSFVQEHTEQENIGKSFPPWKSWSLDLRAHR